MARPAFSTALLVLLPVFAAAQVSPTNSPSTIPPTELQRLAQSNAELLDLLKKQQGVLQDIQYDRRLQNRQIEQLEERLTETLQDNGHLQAQVAELKADLAARPAAAPVAALPATNPAAAAPPTPTPDHPPPASYLPAPTDGWRRLFTLAGSDSKTTDPYPIASRQWRVVWHNQDKPGPAFENTSALFISAFPNGDTIPQKVCAKLGSGGDKAELLGPGTFHLKIEASGGSWELAVETSP
jgi:hypothetical protein